MTSFSQLVLQAFPLLVAAAIMCSVLRYVKRRRQEHARRQLHEYADRPFRFLPETPDSSDVLTPPTQRSSGCMSTLQSAGQATCGAFGDGSTPEKRWLNAELSADVQATQRLIQEELDEDDSDLFPHAQRSSCRGGSV